MADEKPQQTTKIVVDDDWKSQARAEKERLAAEQQKPRTAAAGAAGADLVWCDILPTEQQVNQALACDRGEGVLVHAAEVAGIADEAVGRRDIEGGHEAVAGAAL